MTQSEREFTHHHTPNTTIRLEPPDVSFITIRGEVVLEDLSSMASFYENAVRDWPYIFTLVDQRRHTGMRAEVRKTATTLLEWMPLRGTAIYGGSFAMRTFGKMFMSLFNTVRKLDNPMTFVKTEEEARAWIAERRRELAETRDLPKAAR